MQYSFFPLANDPEALKAAVLKTPDRIYQRDKKGYSILSRLGNDKELFWWVAAQAPELLANPDIYGNVIEGFKIYGRSPEIEEHILGLYPYLSDPERNSAILYNEKQEPKYEDGKPSTIIKLDDVKDLDDNKVRALLENIKFPLKISDECLVHLFKRDLIVRGSRLDDKIKMIEPEDFPMDLVNHLERNVISCHISRNMRFFYEFFKNRTYTSEDLKEIIDKIHATDSMEAVKAIFKTNPSFFNEFPLSDLISKFMYMSEKKPEKVIDLELLAFMINHVEIDEKHISEIIEYDSISKKAVDIIVDKALEVDPDLLIDKFDKFKETHLYRGKPIKKHPVFDDITAHNIDKYIEALTKCESIDEFENIDKKLKQDVIDFCSEESIKRRGIYYHLFGDLTTDEHGSLRVSETNYRIFVSEQNAFALWLDNETPLLLNQ